MNYFYGGAFNPMTKAHLQIIQSILKDMNEDDRLIIGITNHDYKTYKFDYDTRKRIVIENLVRYCNVDKIRLVEQNQRTWKFLNDNFKEPIILVMGEDEYNDLKSLNIWKYSQEILDTFPIKVFSRSEETKDISATKVRELLKNNATYEVINKYITKETWVLLKGNKNGLDN